MEISDGQLIPERGDNALFSSWNIAFFGALALLIILPIVKPDPYWTILTFIPDGVLVTFEVTVISILLSLVVGLFVGLGRISRNILINRIATVYVEIIRGIPLLVQLFYIYFALGGILRLSPFISAITAMTICYGAYMAEIFRAGLQSIPRGQFEAALALGLSRGQAIRKIILPQTIKIILPPVGNEFIAMLKDSSLVSILAVSDLLRRAREYSSTTFEYFEAFTVVALVYLLLTLFFSKLVGILEERLDNRDSKKN
ncbi:amino acid ABC transporter permease [Spirochaeta lutea]|uniref:Putative glutamine transport system permease protein GlnP n=1 Tax=Spirochaeta lutea TaxID=1480694 RepID=A0A098QW67_9SPIO|nr:amino acid ABC transporter permease [Spirochaeta lutea]